MILLHPVFAVAEQEVLDFVLAVVDAAGAPGRMMSGSTPIEIKVVPSVKAGEAFSLVGNAVRVDYVHDDGYPVGVGLIDQGLELLRGSETAAQCEEIGNLVTETAVVRVLLKGHYLNHIVAQPDYSGQYVAAELF